MLRFYIPFIYIGEFSKEGSEGLTQSMKESALMTGTNQAVLSITLEHRRIEKGLDERRVLSYRAFQRISLRRHLWQQNEKQQS